MPSPFVIADLPGFTPQIARLACMLDYARRTTIEAVEGLSTAQLDHLHDPRSNTIGGLLAHIAAVEVAYQLATFEGRGFTREEETRWRAALDLGERARCEIRGYDLEYYLGTLETVRAKTLRELARRDDRWLDEETPFWDGLPANNYFKWFHVLEDEISHRGQIRWLRKRLPGLHSGHGGSRRGRREARPVGPGLPGLPPAGEAE